MRRGFSIIEAALLVVVISLALPPSLLWLARAADQAADEAQLSRATALATGVLESAVADMTVGAGAGSFATLTTSSYVEASGTGLRDRLSTLSAPYSAAGLTWSLEIEPATTPAGVASTDPLRNICRVVTVKVRFTRSDGTEALVPISTLVVRP